MKFFRAEDVQPLVDLLEAIRSQMCWERDRDQLTMGMADLHTSITKALSAFQAVKPVEIGEEFDGMASEDAAIAKGFGTTRVKSPGRISFDAEEFESGARWQHDQIMKKLRGEK